MSDQPCREYTPRFHLRILSGCQQVQYSRRTVSRRKEFSMQKTVKLVKKGSSIPAPKLHRCREIVARPTALAILISLGITTLAVGPNLPLASPIFTPSDQDQPISSLLSPIYA